MGGVHIQMPKSHLFMLRRMAEYTKHELDLKSGLKKLPKFHPKIHCFFLNKQN